MPQPAATQISTVRAVEAAADAGAGLEYDDWGRGGCEGGEEELRDLQCMRMRCEEAGGAKMHDVRRGMMCEEA